MKLILTLVPIAFLLVLGLVISLRSGVETVKGWDRKRQAVVANISGLLVRLFGLLTGLVVVHRLIGYPIVLNW